MYDKLPKDVIRALILNYFDPLSSLRFLQTCKTYKQIITEVEFQITRNRLKYINRIKYLTNQVYGQFDSGSAQLYDDNYIAPIDENILSDCIKYFANENNYEKLANINNLRAIEREILTHKDYILKIKKYGKSRFDVFVRSKNRFNFGESRNTTIAQLHFFKWYFTRCDYT